MKYHQKHLFSFFTNVSVLLCSLLVMSNMQPVFAQAIKVEIVENNGKYTLLRGGEPYIVKGVGTVDTNFERAAKYGANSIRTWSVDSMLWE
jgi:hypothetical protein